MLIALIVTGAFPVDVSVTDCVACVFTFTLPKLMLVVLALRAATQAVSSSANVLLTPFWLAVNIAT